MADHRVAACVQDLLALDIGLDAQRLEYHLNGYLSVPMKRGLGSWYYEFIVTCTLSTPDPIQHMLLFRWMIKSPLNRVKDLFCIPTFQL